MCSISIRLAIYLKKIVLMIHSAEKERDQARWHSKVFMDAADPIIIEDLKGNILELNLAATKAYGYSQNELVGKPIKELVPEARHSQADDLLKRCIAGEDVRNVEGLRQTKKDDVIPVLLTLSALRDEDGSIVAIATIAKDISGLKQVEQELALERNQLEARVAERTREVQLARKELQTLADKLSKYVSPKIYQTIFEGSQEATITAKRKWLTVFFSDIVGFTAISEANDPEEVTELLNEYLNEMTSVVFKYGGTLDKYIGDAILVFFGDPESKGRNTDAVACISMALEMRDRMNKLRIKWKQRGHNDLFHIRIGVASGFCTVGNFGSDDQMSYTIIGRQVNLASRIESAAQVDGILISQPTWALAEGKFRCVEQEPVNAKGFEKKVEVYSVLGHTDSTKVTNIIEHSNPKYSIWLDLEGFQDEFRQEISSHIKKLIKKIDSE